MENTDPNLEAHRVATESTGPECDPASPELEAAWEAWSKQIKRVDQRAKEIIRAAFEAGFVAGQDRH